MTFQSDDFSVSADACQCILASRTFSNTKKYCIISPKVWFTSHELLRIILEIIPLKEELCVLSSNSICKPQQLVSHLTLLLSTLHNFLFALSFVILRFSNWFLFSHICITLIHIAGGNSLKDIFFRKFSNTEHKEISNTLMYVSLFAVSVFLRLLVEEYLFMLEIVSISLSQIFN